MVMTITEEEYNELKKRADLKLGRITDEAAADPLADKSKPSDESILMGKIMKYCKEEGFPCQCFRTSRKAIGFITPGWPD